MHPPFGFALFYLRSVAPFSPYRDVQTGKMTEPVTTGQIYWGAVPFVLIQIVMVGLLIAFPQLVTSGLDKQQTGDTSNVQIMSTEDDAKAEEKSLSQEQDKPADGAAPAGDAEDPAKALEQAMKQNKDAAPEDDDPAKALERAMKK
jgi:hypothetical protein